MAARLVLEDGTQYAGRLFGAARSVPGEVGEPPAAHVEYCTCSRGYCCAFGNAAQQIAHALSETASCRQCISPVNFNICTVSYQRGFFSDFLSPYCMRM